jgi:hypothetical protein
VSLKLWVCGVIGLAILLAVALYVIWPESDDRPGKPAVGCIPFAGEEMCAPFPVSCDVVVSSSKFGWDWEVLEKSGRRTSLEDYLRSLPAQGNDLQVVLAFDPDLEWGSATGPIAHLKARGVERFLLAVATAKGMLVLRPALRCSGLIDVTRMPPWGLKVFAIKDKSVQKTELATLRCLEAIRHNPDFGVWLRCETPDRVTRQLSVFGVHLSLEDVISVFSTVRKRLPMNTPLNVSIDVEYDATWADVTWVIECITDAPVGKMQFIPPSLPLK